MCRTEVLSITLGGYASGCTRTIGPDGGFSTLFFGILLLPLRKWQANDSVAI